MLTYDEHTNTAKVKKLKLNCFSNSGMYIGTNLSTKLTGNVVLDNVTLIKARKENPHLNLDGLSQVLSIPANLINKVLNLGGTIYKEVSKTTGNNYFIFVQGGWY